MWRFLAHSVVNASEKVVDHLPPYFFVIDEINRAELSRTFGELMYALEYRGAAHRIKTQYSSLVRTKEDAGAFLFDGRSNYFFVPFNVFVYGTMNTIDRSVESFDFALRRRFRWVQVTPDLMAAREIMEAHGVEDATAIRAVEGLGRLNEGISADRYLGPDFCVGHAYMKHLSEYDGPGGPRAALEFLWRSRLEPLIQEYLRSTGRPDTNQRVVLFRQAFLGS
jgi:5-methylcytosine-specific restriction protein B